MEKLLCTKREVNVQFLLLTRLFFLLCRGAFASSEHPSRADDRLQWFGCCKTIPQTISGSVCFCRWVPVGRAPFVSQADRFPGEGFGI